MKQPDDYSDEMLNAYIDGELSVEDELTLLDAMRKDTVLLNRVNELKRAKLLVTATYRTDEVNERIFVKNNRIILSLVASLILMAGILGGWLSHDILLMNNSSLPEFSRANKSMNENSTWNIVLHVNSNDKYVQKTILDETESLLESFRKSKHKVKVEIVAYGKGVFLFDKMESKYKERLISLEKNFSNLSYAVCGRTVKRLEVKLGRKIQLISKMTVARSGIYQIIKRQKQGWNYIRI